MQPIKKIYGNGCSFMAYGLPRTEDTIGYLEILAKRYNCEFHNAGLPGSCNRRIIRNALRHAINLDSNCLVLLSLTFLVRTEKYSSPSEENQWKLGWEDYKESIKPNNNKLEPHNKLFVDTYLKQFDERAEITDVAADVLMLTSYLKSRNIPYFIYAHRRLLDKEQSVTELRDTMFFYELNKDPGVLNLLNDSLCDRVGTGDYWILSPLNHYNDQGNQRAADVLEQLITTRLGELK